MAYPSRSKAPNNNTEATIVPPQVPTTGAPQAPFTVGPQGGAPKTQPWSGTPSTKPATPLPPSPWSLKDIGSNYQPVVDRIKANLQKEFAALPAQEQTGNFWQGFNNYPEAMAQMIARRALTNQMHNQVNSGPVAKWLSWIEGRK